MDLELQSWHLRRRHLEIVFGIAGPRWSSSHVNSRLGRFLAVSLWLTERPDILIEAMPQGWTSRVSVWLTLSRRLTAKNAAQPKRKELLCTAIRRPRPAILISNFQFPSLRHLPRTRRPSNRERKTYRTAIALTIHSPYAKKVVVLRHPLHRVRRYISN